MKVELQLELVVKEAAITRSWFGGGSSEVNDWKEKRFELCGSRRLSGIEESFRLLLFYSIFIPDPSSKLNSIAWGPYLLSPGSCQYISS